MAATTARRTAGLVTGALGAVAEAAFVVGFAAAALPLALGRRPLDALITASGRPARALAQWDRRRLARWFETPTGKPVVARNVLAFLAARSVTGLLGGAILALVVWGLATVAVMVRAWLLGVPADWTEGPDRVTASTILVATVPGAVLLYLAVQGLVGVIGLERRLAYKYLGPSRTEALQRRIDELAESRAGVVAAVDAERRRIERDLHDGVQQRLVALGMLLGRARRAGDSARTAELVRAAHEESQQVLNDLREVAWRVYPAALDTLGLEDALAAVAERAGVPVVVECRDGAGIPDPVASAVYFVVSEAVTNAVKHAQASRIDVVVHRRDGRVLTTVADDGVGGADPVGGGLSGLRRRVAALDGVLDLTSPPGGPTIIEVTMPCE